MPKLTKLLLKYRKKTVRGRIYAVVTLDGKDYYLGDFDTIGSRREYERLTSAWLANGRRPVESGHVVSITELIAAYWRFANGYYVKNGKPTGELGCIKTGLRHVRYL